MVLLLCKSSILASVEYSILHVALNNGREKERFEICSASVSLFHGKDKSKLAVKRYQQPTKLTLGYSLNPCESVINDTHFLTRPGCRVCISYWFGWSFYPVLNEHTSHLHSILDSMWSHWYLCVFFWLKKKISLCLPVCRWSLVIRWLFCLCINKKKFISWAEKYERIFHVSH